MSFILHRTLEYLFLNLLSLRYFLSSNFNSIFTLLSKSINQFIKKRRICKTVSQQICLKDIFSISMWFEPIIVISCCFFLLIRELNFSSFFFVKLRSHSCQWSYSWRITTRTFWIQRLPSDFGQKWMPNYGIHMQCIKSLLMWIAATVEQVRIDWHFENFFFLFFIFSYFELSLLLAWCMFDGRRS